VTPAPARMRAMVLREWGGALELETRPVPRPGPGEALVRVVACGAGLTLQHIRAGVLGGSPPVVMGHELGGVVAEAGPGVDGMLVGRRVTATFNRICGTCRWCTSGRETLCEHHGGFIGAAVDGAFAEYAVVPAMNLVLVPDAVDLRVAGIVSDAVATPYHAARERARIVPGQRVAVLGAGGGVGVHMVEVASAFGARVVAVERDGAKAERLAAMGHAVMAGGGVGRDSLVDAAGGELDAVFDMVCTQETFALGVAALGRGGTFIVVGAHPGTLAGLSSIDMINKEKTITGSRNVTRAEIGDSLALVAEGRVAVHVGATYELEQLDQVFDAIARNAVFGRILVEVGSE
jgi:D-arabinose 1-dehydrogenase-like Zn-dependent alcohol dehydrogenase